MSEERKPTPPSYPRPQRSRFSSVRPLVPVRKQTPSTTDNTNRPGRPLRTPVSPLLRVADLPKRSLVPTPPTTAKSPSLQGRRPIPGSLTSLAPPKRPTGRSFVPGKNVQKKDEKQNTDQLQQKSIQETKGEVAKADKISEETKSAATPKGIPKKVSLFNHASPPSLEYFENKGIKISGTKSSNALYKSRIPVLTRQQPRQKASKVNTSQANEEKPDEVKVVDEPTRTVAARQTPVLSIARDNVITKHEERPSHTKTRQLPSAGPIIPHRLKPLRLHGTNGDKNHGTNEPLRAVEENVDRFSSRMQRERRNIKEHGGVLPSKFTPDRKTTEIDKVIQASEEILNPSGGSSCKLEMKTLKPLGDILPATSLPETETTELDKVIQASEEILKPLGESSFKIQMKTLKPLGDILPTRLHSETKPTEQAAKEDPNPLVCSSSSLQEDDKNSLGDIIPPTSHPETKTTELKKAFQAPEQDCTSKVQAVTQMAVNEMIREMQQLRDHLKDVKARQCSKAKSHTQVLDYAEELDQNADLVKLVKTLANDMNIMVKDIDLDMTCVHQAAREIVENMVERLKKSKDNFEETLLKHEKEILRLQGVNNELKYSAVEGETKFKSLEKAMDLTNEEYEKLEKRNAELLKDNQRLEDECQKMKDDMMFRARELGSEDLLEQNQQLAKENEKLKLEALFRARELANLHLELQRRDRRSTQLLDEYHVLWKDKNTLNLKVATLEMELKQIEHTRLSLHEHNSALGCQIAELEDKIRELEHRNASDEPVSIESDELTNSGSEIDPGKLDVVPESTEPEMLCDSNQTNAVPDIGVTEHVLFVQDGTIINGLAESSKKMPTAALDAFKKIEKPSYIMTRNGRKIQRYQSVEHKTSPEQANKSVSILKMMSEKIQRLEHKHADEQKCEDRFDNMFTDTTQEVVEKPHDNIVFQSPACSKSVVGMAGASAEKVVQGAVEETLDNVVQSSACSESVAGMAEESIPETTSSESVVQGMMNENLSSQGNSESHADEFNAQETLTEVAGSDAAVDQEIPEKTAFLEVESSILAQDISKVEINDAVIQLQTGEYSLGESSVRDNAPDSGEKQKEQHVAVSQDFQPNAPHPEWVVEELNTQLQELQTIIEILREKNAQLEDEKIQIISEHQGFLLENMQEVKRLQKLEQSLNDKERFLEEKFESNNSSLKKSKLQLKEDEDWFDECMKATNRVRQIEDLMAKQDKMLSDVENDRDRLMNDNQGLRQEMANMLAEDVSLLGLPKPLQGLEDIVKQLRRSKIFSNGVRKKIRCYTKCNVAIEALQRMNPDTIVISIGDITTNDNEQPPPPPKTPVLSPQEQLLIKKPKLIKKHRMRNKQNQLFQNPVAARVTPNGTRGGMFSGGTRPKHKRKNPSMFLRLSRNLDGIYEGREELLEERLKASVDEGMQENAEEMREADLETPENDKEVIEEMGNEEMGTVDVNETTVEEMGTVDVNETTVEEMGNEEMRTVDVNDTTVEEMGNEEMGTVDVNETTVIEMGNAEMGTVDVNETTVEEMGNEEMGTVDVNETTVIEMGNAEMGTVAVNETTVEEMGNEEMGTVDVNETTVIEMGNAEMGTVDVNETTVEEMGNEEMGTVDVNETTVIEMGNAEMGTVAVNETTVEEMGNEEMGTVDVNETTVIELGNAEMGTVAVNETTVEEMGNEEMRTVDVNETTVEEMGNEEMGKVDVNETTVEEMGNEEVRTVEMSQKAVGEMVSAEERMEKENEKILSQNFQELAESVRKLEMLRKSLAKKPKKKKKVDRMA